MSSDLSMLEALAPAWAVRVDAPGQPTVWLAAPPLPSGAKVAATLLRIQAICGKLRASEAQPGTRLPAFCPELHINQDGSFCLARHSFPATRDDGVAAFWQSLGEFLVNQHQASRRGFWPAGRWLSHGPTAADLQVVAEAAATEAGIEQDYARWLEAGEGWLAEPQPALHPSTGRLQLKGAPCPRGCRAADGNVIPLRRCTHRASLTRLIEAELLRRRAERRFFDALRRDGATCCGRIVQCPLASREAA